MMTSAPLALVLSFAAGLGLGLFYFGGLWLTVKRLAAAGQPALLAVGSLLLRNLAALAGFWFVMGGQLDRLIAAVLGFFIVRTLLIRRLRPRNEEVLHGNQP